MIDVRKFQTCRVERLPQGAIAWVEDFDQPVLVLENPMLDDDERGPPMLLDLGGKNPFDIWSADQVAGRSALFITGARLEIEPTSRAAIVSPRDRVGHAFVSAGQAGLIGVRHTGRPGSSAGVAVTFSGDTFEIKHTEQNFAFSRWRIVHGEGEEAATLFESV